MAVEIRAMPHTREWVSRNRPASMAASGIALIALLTASMCSTAAPPKTAPPASSLLRLPGFCVPPPPGDGWHGLAERSIRTASFSKKWAGFGRWLINDQRRAEISVTALLVLPGQWALAGDELNAFLRNEYAMDLGFGVASSWVTGEHAGRTYQYQTREGLIDGTPESTGLETFLDEPEYKESDLFCLLFPPDLEQTHRYFEISLRITSIEPSSPFQKKLEIPLLEPIIRGLQIVGPFDDLPGPAGALARAIAAGDAEAALKAVDEGADVNAALPDWTPLEIAAHCDRRDLADRLVRKGGLAEIFSANPPVTPFLLALFAGQPEIAAVLLDKGVRIDRGANEDALAPLSMAAVLGYSGVVSRLIARGADVDVRAAGGRTPLMLACESGSLECARALIEAGAGPDLQAEDGGTAVMTAVDWGRSEIMRLLLENGADINIQDNEGWSCLLVAIFQGDAGLAEELIAAGADVDANVFATGQTALLQALEGDKFDIARMLIASGANVNLHKDGQVTPLMVAAAKDRSDLVRLLIENGADVNARTDDQKTALTIAEAGGLAAVAELLIKAGARK